MIPSTPRPHDHARNAGLLPFPSDIRRILCPTDLSDESDTAVAHAFLIAERFDSEVTLFHSIDVRKVARVAGRGAAFVEALRRAASEATRHLDVRVRRTSARTRVTVDYGLSPYPAVAEAIAAGRPDLTVMSTHGRRGIAHLLKGSVAETAIEKGGRPILCVRGRHHGPALPYRRLLVPTDLRSRAAFPIGALMAAAFGAEVVALHVVPFARASLSGLPQALDAAVPSEAEVARFLEPEFHGLPVTARVELGPGWEVIPSIAGEEGCDLIVMSTHRHDSLADAMLGSRAERIATLAPCPVIVV
jgi:nucleotide-binding universal stress UspA family protein